MEMLEQILGQEGEDRILCGPDLVVVIQLQELTQFPILCGGRYYSPLLPQALLGKTKWTQTSRAIHESTVPVVSDPTPSSSPLRSLLLPATVLQLYFYFLFHDVPDSNRPG